MKRVICQALGCGLLSSLAFGSSQSFDLQFLERQAPFSLQEDDRVKSTVELVDIIVEPDGNRLHKIFLDLGAALEVIHFVRQAADNKQVIPFEDLDNKEVVLAQAGDRDAVLLGCENCKNDQGGRLNLKYLYNGITMSYRNFPMIIEKNAEGKWLLYTTDWVVISSMRLLTRSIFGQVIGIDGVAINGALDPEPDDEDDDDLGTTR